MRSQAFAVLQQLRDAGVAALSDTQGRSLKSQFKVAGKSGAALAVVVGPDELAKGEVKIRDFATHEETLVSVKDVASTVARMLA